MLENFLFTLNGVVPLFIVVWIGSILKHKKLLSPVTIAEVNKLCFNILLPCSLFYTIYSNDITSDLDFKLIGYLAGSFVLAAVSLSLIMPLFIKNRPQAGAAIHGAFRANVVLLGIPLAQNLLDPRGASLMAVAIAVLVPLFNVQGVIVLTCFSEDTEKGISLKQIATNIVKNPMIIAAFLGFVASILKLPLPALVLKPVADFAKTATPIAMLVLGAQFSFESAFSHLKLNVIASSIKLVLLPTLFTCVGFALGFRGIELGVIFISHAVPSAASSAMLADSMGCDGVIAGEIVLITSAFSMVTIFIGSLVLKTLGVI